LLNPEVLGKLLLVTDRTYFAYFFTRLARVEVARV
jgi:hypothetical protein